MPNFLGCLCTGFETVPGLTEKLKEFFKNHDVNNDGVLSREELKTAFKDLGAWWPGWRTDRALHHVDANDDGVINPEEFDELVKYAIKEGYKVK